ncbi:MAG: serine/threonine-protein kinase [Bowdeniella nasicola]|nr:serine/threonine-protein kinase [Bowdeniella nasicola]
MDHQGEPAPRPAPGVHFGGYHLIEQIGSGGMGVVYRAVDADGRDVAVKILHPAIGADPAARARLAREVATLHRVRGAGVARVLDAEVDDDTPFVVTELIDGPTLRDDVEEWGVYDASELAGLASGLKRALEQIHAAGVVHRDLKPSNVMMGESGPVLIDFGIAQVVDDARFTQTGLVSGTAGYLDPQALAGSHPSPAGDWWSWAAVLTYAATGRPPFGGGAAAGIIGRVHTHEVDVEGLTPRVAQMLRAALDPTIERRPSPDAVLACLYAAATSRTSPAPLATRESETRDVLVTDHLPQAGLIAPAPATPPDGPPPPPAEAHDASLSSPGHEGATTRLPERGEGSQTTPMPEAGHEDDAEGAPASMSSGRDPHPGADARLEDCEPTTHWPVTSGPTGVRGHDAWATATTPLALPRTSDEVLPAAQSEAYGSVVGDPWVAPALPGEGRSVPRPYAVPRPWLSLAILLALSALGMTHPGYVLLVTLILMAATGVVGRGIWAHQRSVARYGPRPADGMRIAVRSLGHLVAEFLALVWHTLIMGLVAYVIARGAPLVDPDLSPQSPLVAGAACAGALIVGWWQPSYVAGRDCTRRLLGFAFPSVGWRVLNGLVLLAFAAFIALLALSAPTPADWSPVGFLRDAVWPAQ